jgi:hypothetical protein
MSANSGILTYNSGAYNLKLNYYAPSSTIATTGNFLGTLYCFLSKVDPWPIDEVPPPPEETQSYLNSAFRNMFVAKKIGSNDTSPVIQRIDWTTGTTYDAYSDQVNMFELSNDGTIAKKFYVKNRFDQVFKCLWNDNDTASTVEPFFEPGTFNSNQIFQGADNYKWKYMYTITSGNKLKFMDSSWMPVPVGNTIPNPFSTYAGTGDIEVINVTNGGSGYDEANAVVTVTVTGDGYLATGNAVVSAGVVTNVLVANTGYNYTFANVSITSAIGSGAVAVSPVSPIGGHGYNPLSELGARHIMITTQFNKDESGVLPTDIDFRQIGIVVSPYAYYGTTPAPANAAIYSTSTDFIVSPGFGAFTPDEIVYQASDGLFANNTFSATVLSFNSVTNTVKLINTKGTPAIGSLFYGQTSGTSRVALQQLPVTFIKNSGFLTYLENRSPTQRSADGSEQIRLVLGY